MTPKQTSEESSSALSPAEVYAILEQKGLAASDTQAMDLAEANARIRHTLAQILPLLDLDVPPTFGPTFKSSE